MSDDSKNPTQTPQHPDWDKVVKEHGTIRPSRPEPKIDPRPPTNAPTYPHFPDDK